MIYVTGDTHGDQLRFLYSLWDMRFTANDTLIICGDFGYLFNDDYAENMFLDDLEKRCYTICFLDGNHENFHAIFSYPEERWNGGRVHRIRKNILHLMRGQVFTIEGKTIFTMGGAYSIDRAVRRLNVSYWEEERPNAAEYKEATKNLEAHQFHVDYILTHTAPRDIILRMGFTPDAHDAKLTGFLNWVLSELSYRQSYRHWFFGHWHLDRDVTETCTALFHDTKPLYTE